MLSIRQLGARLAQSFFARQKNVDRSQRRRQMTLEALEPRLLLSGTAAIDLTAANDMLVLNQTSGGIEWSVNGGSAATWAAPDGIVIQGFGGDDSITLNFDFAAFGALVSDISILGGEGNDSVLLTGNLALGSKSLSADAESIDSQAAIIGAGSVSLTAVSEDDAELVVSRSIAASGAVVLSAQAGKDVSLDSFASYAGASSATVDVTGVGTVISGASVAITADNAVEIVATATANALAELSITQNNTTSARLSGGASVSTPGALLVRATDSSTVDVTIDAVGVLGSGYSVLSSSVTLNRATVAEIVDASVDGAETVDVQADNAGGITARAVSGFVGVAGNAARDAATARIGGAAVGSTQAVGAVTVRAVSQGSYSANGKVATNLLTGDTVAAIEDSHVTAALSAAQVLAGLDAVTVEAIDLLEASADTTPVLADVAALIVDVTLQAAVTRNTVNHATTALSRSLLNRGR